METNGPPSDLVLSHIRLATQGEPVLHNTQPFQRELGGRAHVFAHNGDLLGIRDECHLESRRFTPIGDTDSELAFCCLLERLAELWDQAEETPPSVESRLEVVADFAAWLRPLGPFNFIYSDGDTLFVHSQVTHCLSILIAENRTTAAPDRLGCIYWSAQVMNRPST
jgi:glutamine amidotransferase